MLFIDMLLEPHHRAGLEKVHLAPNDHDPSHVVDQPHMTCHCRGVFRENRPALPGAPLLESVLSSNKTQTIPRNFVTVACRSQPPV